MSDAARTEILRRVRAALAAAPPPPIVVPRDYRRTPRTGVDLVERFVERVADYQATVHRSAPAELPRRIAAALGERAVRRLVVPAGIPAAWLEATGPEIVRLTDDPALSHLTVDAADATISGCAVAVAETGTIVLDAGPSQGRRALTLLPDHHLCVVLADQIADDLPAALPRLDPTRPLTWISGPSATSDIELQRVEGVHGPRVLDVIVVVPHA